MASVYLSEFPGLGATDRSDVDILPMPPLRVQKIAVGAGSVQSEPFLPETVYVHVSADTAANIAWGVNPTATNNDARWDPFVHHTVRVPAGIRAAVIASEVP